MSKNVLVELPTKENSLLDEEAVKMHPIYAKREVIARIFGVSKMTIYRLTKRAEEEKFEKQITVDVSPTMTLYHIKNFESYLQSIHKKYY